MDDSSPQTVETLHGEFSHRFGEPSELAGKGSITVTDEGLRIVGIWAPVSRRSWLLLLTLFASGLAPAFAASFGLSTGPVCLSFVVALVGGATLAVLSTRRRLFDHTIPWSAVRRAGISENALTFQLPSLGALLKSRRRSSRTVSFVRFAVPGYGLKELRPLASQLVRRATGS
jgi:hypothetical protein